MKLSFYLAVIYLIIEINFAVSGKNKSLKPKHILKLSLEEKFEFLNSFDYVFSDIDGVVWNFYGKIEGVSDGYEALRKLGKNVTFITNNSIVPMKKVLKKFKDNHMVVDETRILNPSKNTIKYLKNINFKGLIYIISNSPYKKALHEAGFQFIDGPDELIEETFSSLIEQSVDNQPVRAVILDPDFNFSVIKLLRAQYYLRNPDCLLIIGATNKYALLQKDFNPITPGVFAELLAEKSVKDPIVMGKPGDALVELIKHDFNITDPKRFLMIGDTLLQDVGFGKKSGFQTLLVLTGDSKLDDISEYVPDYYADSMADFGKFLEDLTD